MNLLTALQLPAAVSLVALGLALGACSESKPTAPTQLAARVNKAEISVHQVNFGMSRRADMADPAQRDAASRQVLEGLIDQEMAVQQALERKLDRDPGVLQALAAARREVLARAYAETIASAAAKPTGDEVNAFYEARPALFAQRRLYSLEELAVQATAEQIVPLRERVSSAKAIKDVTDYLKQAQLPVRLNRSTAAPENMPTALVDLLAKGRTGQALFLPAPTGARIVLIASVQNAPLSLEQARPAIEQAIVAQRRRELVEVQVKTLRGNNQVEYLGAFAKGAASSPAAAAVQKPTDPTTASTDAAAADAELVRRGMGGALK